MAENQKIHPLNLHDLEAPAHPLVPHGTQKSDERGHQKTKTKTKKKKRSCCCCCRCLCWTISLVVILLILIGMVIGIMYLVFRPKLPKYSLDRLQITQFNLTQNDTLEATFDLTLTATNPNHKIGIYYGGRSHISVWYTLKQADDQRMIKLCEGGLPEFYQGHRNTTVLKVALVGLTENATEVLRSVQEERGNIPLNVNVDQHLRIKLGGGLKLMNLKFKARCTLFVDALSPTNDIAIKHTTCNFNLSL